MSDDTSPYFGALRREVGAAAAIHAATVAQNNELRRIVARLEVALATARQEERERCKDACMTGWGDELPEISEWNRAILACVGAITALRDEEPR